MEHQNYTLADILAYEHARQDPDPEKRPDTLILADLSLMSAYERAQKDGNLVRDVLFEASQFDDVDDERIRALNTGFEHLLDAVRHGDVKVTPHCYKQFERFHGMISSKTEFLRKREQTSINKQSRRRSKEHHNGSQSREAMLTLAFSLKQVVKQLDHAQYLPQNSKPYEQMMVALAKCWTPEKKDRVRSLADESLVAAALYRTFIEARPTAIITGDHDIAFLLNRVGAHLLNAQMPYPDLMNKAFAANPARVYYSRKANEYIVEHDTSLPITPFRPKDSDKTECENLAKAFLAIGVYQPIIKRVKELTNTL